MIQNLNECECASIFVADASNKLFCCKIRPETLSSGLHTKRKPAAELDPKNPAARISHQLCNVWVFKARIFIHHHEFLHLPSFPLHQKRRMLLIFMRWESNTFIRFFSWACNFISYPVASFFPSWVGCFYVCACITANRISITLIVCMYVCVCVSSNGDHEKGKWYNLCRVLACLLLHTAAYVLTCPVLWRQVRQKQFSWLHYLRTFSFFPLHSAKIVYVSVERIFIFLKASLILILSPFFALMKAYCTVWDWTNQPSDGESKVKYKVKQADVRGTENALFPAILRLPILS